MRIGVDLDGVVANIMEPILERYNLLYETSFMYGDLFSHDLWNVFGVTEDESLKRVLSIMDELDFDEVIVHDGAIDGLRELTKKHELIAITSRPLFFKEKTLKWIEKYFSGIFEKIIFTNQYSSDGEYAKVNMSNVCQAEGIEVMLEDYIKYVNDCSRVCKRVLLFDQPWNQIDELPANAFRVAGWDEVLREINGS
jgi:uncharacterized HAD superfamily protein